MPAWRRDVRDEEPLPGRRTITTSDRVALGPHVVTTRSSSRTPPAGTSTSPARDAAGPVADAGTGDSCGRVSAASERRPLMIIVRSRSISEAPLAST